MLCFRGWRRTAHHQGGRARGAGSVKERKASEDKGLTTWPSPWFPPGGLTLIPTLGLALGWLSSRSVGEHPEESESVANGLYEVRPVKPGSRLVLWNRGEELS